MAPPFPANEHERVQALHRTDILDTPPEEAFDELTRLAATICAAPIALISLVDATRQWFKARVGTSIPGGSRDGAFCAYVVASGEVFVIEDARGDARFAGNAFVEQEEVRFYAGVPLTTAGGVSLGALCVMDRAARVLEEDQRDALRAIARQVVMQLELRREVAERARAERELDRFFDLSLDLLCIAGVDGRFKRLNPAFETVLGFTREELQARPFFDFVHPDDREVTIAELVSLRRGARTIDFENRYVCRDGSVKWLAWTASPATSEGLIYAAARDITGAKESEEALRRSESRTRSIIDNLLGGLVTMDAMGRIESVNPAAERMFGHTAAALVGCNISILFNEPFDTDHLRRATVARVLRRRGLRANGESFVCEISVFEFDGGDRARHFGASILDVSEREEVEQMKKDFVATVSHELRTPLTSIHGSLGLLASGAMGELNDDAAEVVKVAERNSVRLVALINDILEFEKLDEGKALLQLRPALLRPILERAVEMVGPFASQEGVAIDVDSLAATVLADEQRLAQVIVNLLSNAVKYSPRHGRVTLSARARDERIEVRVSDRGTGIPAQAQKKLFQRFYRIDSGDTRTRSGTGLGLAICRSIIHQHGGEIGVESVEGTGSTFWFRVPAVRVPMGELA